MTSSTKLIAADTKNLFRHNHQVKPKNVPENHIIPVIKHLKVQITWPTWLHLQFYDPIGGSSSDSAIKNRLLISLWVFPVVMSLF